MLDLTKYYSIGAALKDAVEKFAGEVCLIEADREREKDRLTYAEFGKRAMPFARALQDAAIYLKVSRHPHVAAELCVQLLCPENP